MPAAAPAVAIEVSADRLDDFRLMLREQLADDHERLREIEAGFDAADAGAVRARIAMVWALAEQAGGVY